MEPITMALLALGGAGAASSIFGNKKKAPVYTPSPQYTDIQFGTLYPKLKDIVAQGGLSFNTAPFERGLAEDIGSQYGGAFRRARAFTAPYGNITAGNRLASNIATSQAQETGRAITGVRTSAEQGRIASLMSTLGLISGLQDPNLPAFQANLPGYAMNQQAQGQQASMFGDLASLLTLYLTGSKGTPGIAPGGTPSNMGFNWEDFTRQPGLSRQLI